MKDWEPERYLQFNAERTRLARELLAQLDSVTPLRVSDLGCGPGNSTALLHQRWPAATITGVDNSPAMLEQARQALAECHFTRADIAQWQPDAPQQIIFANASLQWLPDHAHLFPHLVSQLEHGGYLAVQMPDNMDEPTHVLMRRTASELGYPAAGREPILSAMAYYDLLSRCGCQVTVWRTTYFHVMASVQGIIDWLSSTGLRPWLAPLDSAQQALFLTRYRQHLAESYPECADGNLLMRFPRLFIVARKQ